MTDFKQKGKSDFFVVRVKIQKVAESKKKHFCNGGICRFISHYRDTGITNPQYGRFETKSRTGSTGR